MEEEETETPVPELVTLTIDNLDAPRDATRPQVAAAGQEGGGELGGAEVEAEGTGQTQPIAGSPEEAATREEGGRQAAPLIVSNPFPYPRLAVSGCPIRLQIGLIV